MAQITLNSTGVASSGSLVLQTNGTTSAVTVDASQNVGIGVTPSAWYTPGGYKVMQIGPGMSFDSGNDFRARIASNAFVNSGGDFKYVNTGFASNYNQGSGQHQWFTAASGTAGNAITFTQAMTLDASGNLGIGTTSPSSRLEIVGVNPKLTINANDSVNGRNATLSLIQGVSSDPSGTCQIMYGASNSTSAGTLTFVEGDGTERARIDTSGNLLVGTTGTGTTGGLVSLPNSNNSLLRIGHVSGSGSTSYYHQFYYDGTLIGSIWQSGTTAVAYNTTSDYRLKTNITSLSGALAKVMALKPSQFDWIDGRPDDGFIAHELQAVLPNVVGGEKDAVDAEGNPNYQQVDYARIVTTLTAAIQEQQALITQLQADVAALKA